ncbi:MAG: hypothetical protein ACOY82_18645 [Pseudomonadota bacterium]
MSAAVEVAKPRKWGRRIAKFALYAVLSAVAAYVVAGWIWRFSGSNQWEFMEEKNGVKVYSLKSPGSDSLQVKGVMRMRTTLAGLVAFMQDPTVCDDVGCTHSRMFERVDDQVQYYTFRYDFPLWFKPRDFVVKGQFHQNPKTREVVLEFDAEPDKLPLQDCCFRIADMNNTWRFIPLGNGEVEVQYTMNMDEGGFLPHLLLNNVRPGVMTGLMPELPRLVDKPKYQTAKFDFIVEK